MYPALVAILAFLQTSACFEIQSSCYEQFNHGNCKRLPDVAECGRRYESTRSISPRIRGGKEADISQFPWMVHLIITDNCGFYQHTYSSCGGSLITKTHVLSAAHCLPETVCDCNNCKLSHVGVGEHDKRFTIDCASDGTCAPEAKDIPVRDYTVHKEYNSKTNENDIALIRLAYSVDFNKYVAPICLPTFRVFQSKRFFGEHTSFEAAGWGTIGNNEFPDVLQTVTLPYVSNSRCQWIYGYRARVTKNMLCAGSGKSGSACSGDSGGPLMYLYSEQSPERYFQIGIVSWGDYFCAVPSVFTRVTSYLQWILDNMD